MPSTPSSEAVDSAEAPAAVQVRAYLDELRRALRHVPRDERRQLLAEISAHLDEALADVDRGCPEDVGYLLRQMGSPEDIANEVGAEARVGRPRWRSALPVAGLAVSTAALAIALAVWGASPAAHASHPARVEVPRLVGLTVDRAEAVGAHDGGFHFSIDDEGGPSRGGSSIVLRQFPAPGREVPWGAQMDIYFR